MKKTEILTARILFLFDQKIIHPVIFVEFIFKKEMN